MGSMTFDCHWKSNGDLDRDEKFSLNVVAALCPYSFSNSTKEVFIVQGVWPSPDTLSNYVPRSDLISVL